MHVNTAVKIRQFQMVKESNRIFQLTGTSDTDPSSFLTFLQGKIPMILNQTRRGQNVLKKNGTLLCVVIL